MGGVWATPDEVSQIHNLTARGWSYTQIARKLNRSSTFVSNIARRPNPAATGTTTAETVATNATVTAPATTATLIAIKTIATLTNMTAEEKLRVITSLV